MYEVRMVDRAETSLLEYVTFIAKQRQSPLNAQRWFANIKKQLATLRNSPSRYAIAYEDRYRDYEIRRIVIRDYVSLYTIDEEAKVVWIIDFRHGSRRRNIKDLPQISPWTK